MGKTIQLSGFPHLVTGDTVKEFLERYTGRGTVYALEVRKPQKSGSRVYAIVQFESASYADQIISLAAQRLYYGSSYLKAYAKDFDLVQNPKLYVLDMESITLYLGCQISKEKFSVLWEREDISVKFGLGLRKLYFFLSDRCVDYKLELFYENIWQIELHHPRGQTSKFLLIQLLGAPRIYKKCAESCLNYFKETPEENWVRATDFTPSNSIGQSSALCLGISYSVKLLNFSEYFPYFKESERPFILKSGSSFSCNLDLVPIIGPAHGLELPYRILFKICILVQQGCLSGPTLDINFFRLVDPRKIHITCIEDALEKLYHLRECCYEPVTWLGEQYQKYIKLPKTPAITLDDGLVFVHRVQITPCKVYFCEPEVNVSNRVLRQYPKDIDNFLRVSFVDEELGKLFSTDLLPRVAFSIEERRTGIYRRILSILRDGIVIGDKKFDFLAFSSSQLWENSAWMFASRAGLTAADIRKGLGDFRRIRNVARYAARLGQSFSSSRESLSVGSHEREMIPDVKCVRNGINYIFSDGIGKISADFARSVAEKCGIKNSIPSAFQIRYGGYKGVVAVDPGSTMKISLRESMLKYDSENTTLDVLAWSKYQPCYLNRQLITLLSTLGIMDNIFEKKQQEAVEQLDTILIDPLRAQEALKLMAPGENTNILKEMLLGGYKPNAEPFLSMMLQTFRATKLFEIRTKTRVYVPGGRSMMGCLDETKTLEYGQVFLQISGAGHARSYDNSRLMLYGNDSDQGHRIVVGKVFVAKNPCLHPGDIRVLRAVNVPALRHMVDCVVFPQKGMRPHPNECSGSDLDGDIYFVCWDQDLIPPKQIPPMDYAPAPRMMLGHDVSIEEVQEYFVNYILNDSLGIIANAHTVFADREPRKAMSNPCLKLAKLFSIAVDFPKTGVPAKIPRELRVQDYPDFMEKPDKTSYTSERVIGKLFRAVKDIAPHSIKSFTREVARKSYDLDMEVDGFEDYLEEAFDFKTEYDYKLGNLMNYYGIKTEAEILISGSIMKMSKSFDRRKDVEDVGLAIKSLRKEARTWFKSDENADLYAKASAWYYVTYHHSYWGFYNVGMKREHFISFPWCVCDKLMHIKRDKSSIRRALDLSSLEDKLKYGGRLS